MERISVNGDPWIPIPNTFKLQTRNALKPEWVSDLIDFDLGGWNMEMVHDLFDEEESKLILGIPLSLMGCKDRIIWHYTKHGGYTVRTGYKVTMELQANGGFWRGTGMASGKVEEDWLWKGIWGLHVPNKLKKLKI